MKIKKKFASILLALVMLVSALPMAAFAAQSYEITSQQVTSWWGDLPSNYKFTLQGGGQTLTGICAEPSANPGSVGQTVTLSRTDNVIKGLAYYAYQSESDSDVLYDVHHAVAEYIGLNNGVLSSQAQSYLNNAASHAASAPSGFEAYITSKPSGAQTMLVWWMNPTGNLTLKKSSANTAITNGNDCYSIAGAVYGVYTNSGCTNKVGSLTTVADGTSNTLSNLNAGTYYAKETSAPRGFALDPKVYTITVRGGETAVLEVTDLPQSDPVGVLLQKVDALTGEAVTAGDGSLAGAEYTFRYYDGLYDTAEAAEASGDAARTWVLKTGENGTCRLNSTFMVSGDELYYDSNNQPTLPIGTLLIQETKVPDGYLIDDTVYVRQITPDGTIEAVKSYNAPTIEEQPIVGRIQIVKHTDHGQTRVETPEEGATFDVFLASAGSYDAAPATARDQLTIDKDGFAMTKDLPFGEYTVHQTGGWEGSKFMEDLNVIINENDKTYSYIINNERFYAYLKIVKTDAITGEAIPVEGVGFQIYTPSNELVSFWGVDTWYSDAEGIVKIPAELEYGKGYSAVEVNAPDGYILADKPFVFNVVEEESMKEDDLTIIKLTAPNTPTTVQIDKVDPYGNPVIGAKLQVLNENGTVIDEWVSDGTGHVIHKMSIGGKYTLREVAAPEGMVLASDVTFTVEDTADTQYVTMTDKTVTATKEDMGGKEVPGADMSVTDKDGKVVDKWTSTEEAHAINGLVAGETYVLHEVAAPDGYVKATDIEFTVTDDGIDQALSMIDKIVTVEKLDPYGAPVVGAALQILDKDSKVVDEWVSDGTAHAAIGLIAGEKYTLREVAAPEGMVLASDVTFTVEDTADTQYVTMTDKTVTATKEDMGGKEVPGADMSVTDKDGKVVDKWTSTEEAHAINGLVAGETYVLHEVAAPDGYVKATDIEFTVTDDGIDQALSVIDKIVTVEKLDPYGNPVEGAALELFDSKNVIVDQWVSDGTAHAAIGLIAGEKYTLRETSAPDGWMLADDVTFTVTDDGKDQVVKMEDMEIPEIHTTATVNGEHVALATKDMTLTDVIEHIKLVVGREYRVVTVAMDKTTKEAALDHGKKITSEMSFTATAADGSVDAVLNFDGTELAGHDIVVFEYFYLNGKLVVSHENWDDEGQTVVIPGIHTKATVDGKHEVVAKGPVTIDERVELLPNMPVGVPLTFQASAKDQETGNSILDKNGNPVVVTKVVTLTGKETEVPVPVKIEDASLLAGKTVVMFERVTMEGKDGKQILIATHEDLNSADQSVHFEEPIGKITVTDQPGTGDAGIMAYAAMGGISALGGLALLINRKRRKDEEA